MPEDLRNRIASKIGGVKPTGAQYLGPPVSSPPNPADRLRQSIDRAKERIGNLPTGPKAGIDFMKTNVVNPLVQAGQARAANIPGIQQAQTQMSNITPPAANPDRGLIISWIRQQPAFTWLQSVLAQYGIHLGEILPSTSAQSQLPGGQPGEPSPGTTMGMTDTGGTDVGNSQVSGFSPYGDLTSNPYSGPTNAGGFSNPGFPR